MAYTYLTPENIFRRYTDAKNYTDKLTLPFPEFARIARNKPVANLGNYPKVTDGTTAGIIQKIPRTAVQQLPTGLVESDDDTDWLPIVAQFIYENKILPFANEDYGLFEKCHLLMEGGLTFGAQATFRRFAQHRMGFSPDIELIYWGDLAIQKGKKSGPACDYIFYRTWWQKSDIEALIDSETKRLTKSDKRQKQHKAAVAKYKKDYAAYQADPTSFDVPPAPPPEPSAYEPTWDTQALKQVLDAHTQKDREALTPTEQERGVESTGIELITGFQKGVGNKFYTFNVNSHQIVRTKTNNDPRGEMPIDWFYGGIDGTNPLGRGIVELLGALQNLIDARMQMAQYAATYALNPAVVEYGDADTNFEFLPNKVIHTTDPNYKVEPIEIDTNALTDFISTQQYLQSQLYQLVMSPHTNTPSASSVVTDGKTPAAINANQATMDIDINAIRKHFETWFESWSEGAINQWFAEHSGVEILQLDAKTADKLRELPADKDFDPAKMLNDQNQLIIDYDTSTPALRFRVDPTTSRGQNQADQVQDATNLLDLVMKYPMLDSAYGGPIDHDILARRIVVNSGIEDPEQVAPEPTAAQEQAKEAAKNAPNPFSPMFDKPSIRINFPDLPIAAQVQVLGMAGVQVSPQDIMQGPVIDPNIRGVANPVNVPGAMTPGGQPAGTSPTQQIDLGDIYKGTTDPTVKAKIEAMAGVPGDPLHVQNQIDTTHTQHMADQAGNVAQAAQALPVQQPAQQPGEVTPGHVAELRALGVPDHQIQQAIQIYNQQRQVNG